MTERHAHPDGGESAPRPQAFRVCGWDEQHETSRSAKRPGYVRIPTRHDGRGLRRTLAEPNGVSLYGAYTVILAVAAQCPVRGILADETAPLTADDIAVKTGFPTELIEEALAWFSSPEIRWLVLEPWQSPEPKSQPPRPPREQQPAGTPVAAAQPEPPTPNVPESPPPQPPADPAHAPVIRYSPFDPRAQSATRGQPPTSVPPPTVRPANPPPPGDASRFGAPPGFGDRLDVGVALGSGSGPPRNRPPIPHPRL